MLLKVLVDNTTFTGHRFDGGESGLCYYIEDDGHKILFDTGLTDLFLRNAKVQGVDLDQVDTIILSHGHYDHCGGLKYFFDRKRPVRVICHPETFVKRVRDGLDMGPSLSLEEMQERCELIMTDKPYQVTSHITFLGTIPRKLEWEGKKNVGQLVVGESDNICGVIGGFHLLKLDEQAERTIQYFKDEMITNVYPCHCTCLPVKAKFFCEVSQYKEVGVSMELHWPPEFVG
ncbi:MAG: MBL fold metallo-hydrolase [Firmicutes bacterium]|nr:MBL fold metallo-hydrolase [Bacillota bacterium]